MILVQQEDFNVDEEYKKLISQSKTAGAVVFFVGRVRDFNQDADVSSMFLEHYPAMTEKTLYDLTELAKKRWQLEAVRLIHRTGLLQVSDQIVFAGVSSAHREASFSAVQFIMDTLKTKAPFWKKETHSDGSQKWVQAEKKDTQAASRWT